MQKHNNTNIWIWKFCLLKIYLNTESWWIQVVDSRGMTLTKRRKLQEKIFELSEFLHSVIFFLLLELSLRNLESLPSSWTLAQFCLRKKPWSSIYSRGSRLQEGFVSLISSTCMKIVEGKFPFCFSFSSRCLWVIFLLLSYYLTFES